jgi:hypothetical protein
LDLPKQVIAISVPQVHIAPNKVFHHLMAFAIQAFIALVVPQCQTQLME